MLSRTATRCHLCHVARTAEELKLHTFKISLNGYTHGQLVAPYRTAQDWLQTVREAKTF